MIYQGYELIKNQAQLGGPLCRLLEEEIAHQSEARAPPVTPKEFDTESDLYFKVSF